MAQIPQITFLDCGSHIGESILLARSLFGNDINIKCFEPVPYLATRLSDLYKNDRRIDVFNVAVWDKEAEIDLYISSECSDGSSLFKDKTSAKIGEPIKVKTIDLSYFIKKSVPLSHKLILKLDVEGAEYDILIKMINDGTISRVSELYGEWHSDRIPSLMDKAQYVYHWLDSNKIVMRAWQSHPPLEGKKLERPKDNKVLYDR